MRIVCPACAAAYDVPGDRLATGRVVRCARCDMDWVPLPVAQFKPEPAPEPQVQAEPEPPVATANSPAPVVEDPAPAAIDAEQRAPVVARGSGWALRAAWVVSVVVVLAGMAGAVAGRAGVMQAWPPSIRAYEALGLARSAR